MHSENKVGNKQEGSGILATVNAEKDWPESVHSESSQLNALHNFTVVTVGDDEYITPAPLKCRHDSYLLLLLPRKPASPKEFLGNLELKLSIG